VRAQLDPLFPLFRRLKRIGEVLGLMEYFVCLELHEENTLFRRRFGDSSIACCNYFPELAGPGIADKELVR